jgi:predicted PurR-regulated permease PerM
MVVYLAFLLVLVMIGTLLVPALATQSALAAEQLPILAERIDQWTGGISSLLGGRGIVVGNYTEQLLRPLEAVGPLLVANALILATGAASAVFQIVIIIVLSLYLMLDGERIGTYLLLGVPLRYRDDFIYFVSSVYRAFGGFLRGQIIQSLIYGTGVAVIMLGAGMPFVALTSVLAGIAIFIPFLGPFLAMLPPLIVALTTDIGRTVIVVVLTGILNIVVVNIVQPKVMSQQIGLHPIVVLTAVLVGARLAGPWGALFGVPVAAVIVTMASFYRLTVAERKERVLEVTGPPEVIIRSDGPADDGGPDGTCSDLEPHSEPEPEPVEAGAAAPLAGRPGSRPPTS